MSAYIVTHCDISLFSLLSMCLSVSLSHSFIQCLAFFHMHADTLMRLPHFA